jgi:hypothetical protein
MLSNFKIMSDIYQDRALELSSVINNKVIEIFEKRNSAVMAALEEYLGRTPSKKDYEIVSFEHAPLVGDLIWNERVSVVVHGNRILLGMLIAEHSEGGVAVSFSDEKK